jgi:hypothetical protein
MPKAARHFVLEDDVSTRHSSNRDPSLKTAFCHRKSIRMRKRRKTRRSGTQGLANGRSRLPNKIYFFLRVLVVPVDQKKAVAPRHQIQLVRRRTDAETFFV